MKATSGKRIEFIDYNGKYPNLCRGVLTVLIDGEKYKFGHNFSNYHKVDDKWVFTDEDPDKPNYPEFWTSGGHISFDKDWNAEIESGPWEYNEDLDDYKEFTPELIEELIMIFNSNVSYGCCGGCI